ncbi:MAG: hypothetical protein QHC65_13935 [Sphingomonas sp.]|nr:hypothetical protein [Sphingomonas sp.]
MAGRGRRPKGLASATAAPYPPAMIAKVIIIALLAVLLLPMLAGIRAFRRLPRDQQPPEE